MFIRIDKLYEMRNQEQELTPGQPIWVDGKPAVYLYTREEIQYITYGTPYNIIGNSITVVGNKKISTTPPLPEIKPGTPVLCWDEDYTSSAIWIFQKYTKEGKTMVGEHPNDTDPLTFDHCEVYEY